MVTVTWTIFVALVSFIFAVLCTTISFLCLYTSITAIGWYEISWADKDRLKGDSVMFLVIALIFWSMLYMILDKEGYITVIAGYMPIAITDNGLRIGH